MSTQQETKEVKEQVATNVASTNDTNAAKAKKHRRGINNETRGRTRLKFDEKRDANKANGLFIGHLDEARVDWITIDSNSTGLPSFAGLAIPVLCFVFASNEDDENVRKYVPLRFTPAESTALTIVGGNEEWKVNSIFDWLKHIYDVFVLKGRAMTEQEEELLTLPFDDMDADGNYVPVPAEDVIAGWRVVFENFVSLLNNNGKPVYKTVDGKIIPIWMKLLRYTKFKNSWQPVVRGKSTAGDLGFTSFVGEGCIELYKKDTAPMLKIDISKESIVHKQIAKAPVTPQIPNNGTMAGGVPVAPAIAAPAFGTGEGSPFTSENPTDDLPF